MTKIITIVYFIKCNDFGITTRKLILNDGAK